MLTTTLSVMITGTLLGEESGQGVADYLTGASYCGSTGVLIPGCGVWQDIAATDHPTDPEDVIITAQILAWDGVTPEFVTDYLVGAGDYLIGAGDLFSPYQVVVMMA